MGRIADALERAERQRDTTPLIGRSDRPSSAQGWGACRGLIQEPTLDSALATDVGRASELPVAGLAENIVTYYDRGSKISEQYRSLRTRLLIENPYHEHRLYVVSSAVHGEGKSVTVLNLAFSFAEIRHLNVLVIDADLRRPSLAAMLNAEATPGLTELLLDEAKYEEAVRPTPVANLSFVPAGGTHERSVAELFSTRLARRTFARFQRDYHCVLADAPPVTNVADVGILGQLSSGVILVLRMHRTPEPLARRAVSHLNQNKIPVIGGVVIGDTDPAGDCGCRQERHRNDRWVCG
jgi:capsular exopolysaccharide synthesis family protein